MSGHSTPLARVPISVIRRRVDAFVANFRDATSEASESQTFWNEFFSIFGVSRRRVASFESIAKRASTGGLGFIDLLYPGEMAVEQKSAGEDLEAAMLQVLDYLPSLTEAEMPRLLVVCDFKTFNWQDLDAGTSGSFALAELGSNIELFLWLAGYARSEAEFENFESVNLKATQLLARLHDRLATLSYPDHALREWMTRILFLLFADDAEVWEPAAFHTWLALHTSPDGRDLGGQLAVLFQRLDTPDEALPPNTDDSLLGFAYINGDLFSEQLPIPSCDSEVREALLAACRFDWRAISPAIFGSMFQNVMSTEERRQIGAHYTTEENILKTLRPLFLDELEAELADAATKPLLEKFLTKLGRLTFFDPAAGCGNFLVIAYRELRRLEKEGLARLLRLQGRGEVLVDISLRMNVTVDQMYGIELEEFPAKIARTALYLADHLANREASAQFGQHYVRFPISAAPNIVHGDALELDWNDVLPASKCDYCFGNPPFVGHRRRSPEQAEQMKRLWGRSYIKLLDFVTTWFLLAQRYDQDGRTRFAFVATNSITQGEQTQPLFGDFLAGGFSIDFAHQSFYWSSESRGSAQVMVVIIGFSRRPPKRKRLFSYDRGRGIPKESSARNISPYLIDGPNVLVEKKSEPISPLLPQVSYGNLLSDGGHLTVAAEDVPSGDEVAMKYIRPFVGSKELMSGRPRYCIWMPEGPEPGDLAKSQFLRERLDACRAWRLSSRNADTRQLAEMPYRFFFVAPQPEDDWLAFPSPVSENRSFYTPAFINESSVARLAFVSDPDKFVFALTSSSMFLTWMRNIGGALEMRVSFSKKIVYNTFPTPRSIDISQRQDIIAAGLEVLNNRPDGVPLDVLYAPNAVPHSLVKAHNRLDQAVEKWMAPGRRLASSEQRLEVLLAQYVGMTTGEELLLDLD